MPVSKATWTTKGDFENNASTTGSPTSRNQVLISGTNQTDNADVTLASKKWKNPTTAVGYSHALALKPDGSVWAWGNNYYGQVGDGTSGNGTDKPTPVQVSGLGVGSDVIAVSATYNSSLALKGDGSVWAWGDNTYGQLGDGTSGYGMYKSTPVQVSGLGAGSGVIAIAAGQQHFMALKSDGTVWGWGDNSYYQLGDGTSTPRSVPVIVPGLTGGVAIAAGKIHSFAVKADGSVWSWGYNGNGALGDGTNTSKSSPVQVSTMGPGSGVIALTGGYFHTLAIKVDGSVWAWGSNLKGQLGIVSGNTNSPVQIMAPGSGARAVAAARQSSYLLKEDGSVLAWGLNDYGQLGDGTNTNRTTPVPVSGMGANSGTIAVSAGEFVSQSLNADGTLSAWGYSQSGVIVGGTNGANNTPVPNTLISGIQMPLSYNSLYLNPGTVTGFKVNAGSNVTWSGIYWNAAELPSGTSIKCRTRGADTEGGLSSAIWSDYYLTSGTGITTPTSQWLEVELTLQTSSNYFAPVLADLTVTYFP
jgi:alpha-tubulin suppressor-like RCC1 family protein